MTAGERDPVSTEGIDAVSKSLIEFGYPSATPEKVRQAFARWQAGDEPADIVERFAFGQFDDYPTIFGKRGTP